MTGGCSFSDVDSTEKTWPLHLQDFTQDRFDNFYHLGACSQGQDYISRTVIYKVNELLKNNNSDDIFVIVVRNSYKPHTFSHRNLVKTRSIIYRHINICLN